MGTTNPSNADDGTIKEKYGLSVEENSVHGSDSEENAKIEIDFLFKRGNFYFNQILIRKNHKTNRSAVMLIQETTVHFMNLEKTVHVFYYLFYQPCLLSKSLITLIYNLCSSFNIFFFETSLSEFKTLTLVCFMISPHLNLRSQNEQCTRNTLLLHLYPFMSI